MKKNKLIIVFLFVLIIIVVVSIFLNNNIKNNAKDNITEKITENNAEYKKEEKIEEKKLIYTEFDLIAVNAYYEKNLKYFEATLDDEVAYSIDYGLDIPSEDERTLLKQRDMSSFATAVLRYGYPNVSPEELGVYDEIEARLVTQFALWRIMSAKNGASLKSKYIFDMKNLASQEKYTDVIKRVKTATENLVNKANDSPYVANPTFELLADESKIKLVGEYMIVGPFYIDGKWFDVTSVDTSLSNAPDSAVLCDEEGNEKSSFDNNDNIYIRMKQNIGKQNFDLNVTVKGTHNVAFVYGTGNENDNKQDFCLLETLEDTLSIIQPISVPPLTGDLKVRVYDNYETPLPGMIIQLTDINGNKLKVAETDNNGEIFFEDLLVGKYVITHLENDSNYIIMDIPVEVEVSYDVIRDVVIKDTLIE